MAELGAVLEQLKQERTRLVGEVRQLDQAIKALGKVGTKTGGRGGGISRRARSPLSAAARKRISTAQKARWAKFRAKAAKKAA